MPLPSRSSKLYTIGTFVGEEWIYYKQYVERETNCNACEPSCVLEIDMEQFEEIRSQLLDMKMNKDVSMFES